MTEDTTTDSRFPYQDSSLSTERRVEDLLSRMNLDDKAGLLFIPFTGVGSLDAPGIFGAPSAREVMALKINHVSILQARTARELASWYNSLQTEALKTPLGIPFTIATDPRHAFANNPGTAMTAGPFSQWPEPLGFGAIGDADLVRRFADTVRREYLAVGLRTALHPQIDLASDPRWARASGTFGSNADITNKLAVAYVLGLQGDEVGPESVSAMAKHFPGGGPQKDGEDPHLPYGKDQVYPGGQFELHMQPFREVIAAGVSQIMPYYGKPVGLVLDGEPIEEVGFSFSKQIVTGILRDKLGYDGIVCTDWGILSGMVWGVEDLTYEQRMLKAFDAGVDQFGGETHPETLVDLVKSGKISEDRIDTSVRRVLREKFRLGLFDSPFVDVDAADLVVGTPQARAEGRDAQSAAQTLLKNTGGAAHLPLSREIKVYTEGIEPEAFAGWAQHVTTPAEADVAILRTVAPWEQRGKAGELEFFFHAGSLDFSAAELDHIREIQTQVPTIVDVYLDRPAILKPIVETVDGVLVNFGSTDEAFLRVVFGVAEPKGRLPFEIPSSMDAVAENFADVPNDTADPTFTVGFGLDYSDWSPATAPASEEIKAARASIVKPPLVVDITSTTLAELLEDDRATSIIDTYLPGMTDNPMIDMVKAMPFQTVLDLAGGDLPAEVAATIKRELELI